ncbi:M20/M25/M40 family metallo-hydrolase [Erythrobacter arachoides]|uniref:Carboxypeptidase Q n=1 Tax=Aurantiacibacter arachoides TaxID=1850444 RepID=A0A845A7G1_9SPHN|nr:M20/M25/M40 family metallo-hydrolase [Aurantiacibacter arachoides]MXO93479.1 M20/M25/M40 family metallo-hydrolase [Aurantiacibacter arachoides]GGD49061.1 peptidase M28 [Aurantiacibacter arachoides]
MHKSLLALTALSLAIPATADAQRYDSRYGMEPGAHDEIAWDFLEGITTEIGPRLAGTPDEARGRAWAMEWLRAHGFVNVVDEPFPMPGWLRGEQRARIVGESAQPLVLTALGYSGATPAAGITAEVVHFATIEDLRAAPAGSLAGKIAYVGHSMRATQDGSHYGYFGSPRRQGPAIAASKGAAGMLIRSIGSDNDRLPHTGSTTFPAGTAAIPAAALSNPDADQLERLLRRAEAGGEPVRIELVLTPRQLGEVTSGNVTGEITGRDPSLPPVLLACHLDSWDEGTGAIDDASGCAIAAATALRVAEQGQPLRTIRVLFAGAEENGLWGSAAYSAAHRDEPMAVGIESDFGAGRIWRMETNFTEGNPDLWARLARAVSGYGVLPAANLVASGGADLNIMRDQRGAIVDLQQDGLRYFDLHHTANDTLDKVDPADLAQNVAVWTAVTAVLANEAGPIMGNAAAAD